MDGTEEVRIVLREDAKKVFRQNVLERQKPLTTQSSCRRRTPRFKNLFLFGGIPVQQFTTVTYLNQVDQSLLEVGFAARGFSRISYSHRGRRGLGGCRRNRGWRRLAERLLEGAGREEHRMVWPRNRETWSLRDSLEVNKRKMTMLA